jgi:NADPH:quinone reductase
MDNSMRAIIGTSAGPDLRQIGVPSPKSSEVLVRVAAAALNRADLRMLTGDSHGSFGGNGQPLGLEWAGEIVAFGEDVTGWRVGDRVMCAGAGAFAEYAVAPQERLITVPDGLDFIDAAVLPVSLLTMHDAIVSNGRLQAGQSVFIQGASTGVGLMGLQIAKALGAALVLGSSMTAKRRERLGAFGADVVIDTSSADWHEAVIAATDGGVDVLIDQVAGDLINQNMMCTRIGGRIVNVGRVGGEAGQVDFNLHALRRLHYVGVTFRTRSDAEVAEVVRSAVADLGPLLQADRLRLPIDTVFPLAQAQAAFAKMSENRHFGKIVLAD